MTHVVAVLARLHGRELLKFGSSLTQALIQIVGENGKVAIRVLEAAIDAAIIRVANAIELRRVGDRQGAQQNALDQGEDGGIRADAESQGEHGRQRKAR